MFGKFLGMLLALTSLLCVCTDGLAQQLEPGISFSEHHSDDVTNGSYRTIDESWPAEVKFIDRGACKAVVVFVGQRCELLPGGGYRIVDDYTSTAPTWLKGFGVKAEKDRVIHPSVRTLRALEVYKSAYLAYLTSGDWMTNPHPPTLHDAFMCMDSPKFPDCSKAPTTETKIRRAIFNGDVRLQDFSYENSPCARVTVLAGQRCEPLPQGGYRIINEFGPTEVKFIDHGACKAVTVPVGQQCEPLPGGGYRIVDEFGPTEVKFIDHPAKDTQETTVHANRTKVKTISVPVYWAPQKTRDNIQDSLQMSDDEFAAFISEVTITGPLKIFANDDNSPPEVDEQIKSQRRPANFAGLLEVAVNEVIKGYIKGEVKRYYKEGVDSLQKDPLSFELYYWDHRLKHIHRDFRSAKHRGDREGATALQNERKQVQEQRDLAAKAQKELNPGISTGYFGNLGGRNDVNGDPRAFLEEQAIDRIATDVAKQIGKDLVIMPLDGSSKNVDSGTFGRPVIHGNGVES